MQSTPRLKDHPAAALFPKMNTAQFAELKQDIEKHGLIDPIWMCDGKILDGRNRYRACMELGIAVRTRDYSGGDPEGFVLSVNLARRHLSAQQRRAILKKYLQTVPEKSSRQVAAETGVSKATINRVRREGGSNEPPRARQPVKQFTPEPPKTEAQKRATEVNLSSLTKPADLEFHQFFKFITHVHPSELTDPLTKVELVREQLDRLCAPIGAAARVEQEHAAVMAEVATLPESAKAKFERLVKKEHEILRARYFIEMEAAVRANTAKEKADYLEASAATHKACEAWKAKMRNLNDWMTREEFKLVLGCLHPDRQTDEEARRRFGRAFDIFNRLKVYAEGWQ